MAILVIVLRAMHIVGGVFWAGAAITLHGFVMPSISATQPDSRGFMRHLANASGLTSWMLIASIVCVVGGLALFAPVTGQMSPEVMRSPRGMVLGLGALLAIGAFAEGFAVSTPTATRLGSMLAGIESGGGSPSPEQGKQLAALQRKLSSAGRRGAIMLGVATLCMAVARYL